jgi:hypothetical protein
VAAVKKGLVAAKGRALDRISAGAANWQASAWFLERRWPEQWGGEKQLLREAKKLLAERAGAPPERPGERR